jgi:hypothetical protein
MVSWIIYTKNPKKYSRLSEIKLLVPPWPITRALPCILALRQIRPCLVVVLVEADWVLFD